MDGTTTSTYCNVVFTYYDLYVVCRQKSDVGCKKLDNADWFKIKTKI